MSKNQKKDLRNGRESGQWHPHDWNEERRAKFCKHVRTHALLAIADGLPPFEASNASLNLRAFLASNESAHRLHDLGFKTLGETAQENRSEN